MLLPRLLTAFVGIPVLLLLIHLGSWPFIVFSVGVCLLALYEYCLILWMGNRKIQRATTVIGGGCVAAAVALGPVACGASNVNFAAMSITALILAAVFYEMFQKEHSLERAALTLFGTFFIGWTFAHLALLRDLRPDGEGFTMLLFAVIWSIDTAAYAVGRSFGSRPLASVISPRKTWEGAAAGFAAAMIVTVSARGWFLWDALTFPQALFLGALLGVLAQISDLAESMIKRAVGAKDSSALLPGHGGVLDRFDSFFLTAPCLYYFLLLK